MKSASDSPTPAPPLSCATLTLEVRGKIPTVKNSRLAVLNANGKGQKVITSGQVRQRLREIEADFASQLLCGSQTDGDAIWTAQRLRSWIASSVPADDCWTILPEIHLTAELCEPGQEGATIKLEKLKEET